MERQHTHPAVAHTIMRDIATIYKRRSLMRLHWTLCNKWIAQDDARHKQAVTLLIRALAVLLCFAELRNKVHAELKMGQS